MLIRILDANRTWRKKQRLLEINNWNSECLIRSRLKFGIRYEKKITMPLHSGSLVLSNSKRNMNVFKKTIAGFKSKELYNQDIDPLFIESKHWDSLSKAGLIGRVLIQGKTDHKDGGIFYGLLLAPKIK